MNKNNVMCEICGKEFTPQAAGDKFCGILCLNGSITDEEQENAINNTSDRGQSFCPICGRHKKYLIHKRMNGQWYLWQTYHYDNNTKSLDSCYYCNLWEMNYRKRTGQQITPEQHRKIIGREKNE